MKGYEYVYYLLKKWFQQHDDDSNVRTLGTLKLRKKINLICKWPQTIEGFLIPYNPSEKYVW